MKKQSIRIKIIFGAISGIAEALGTREMRMSEMNIVRT